MAGKRILMIIPELGMGGAQRSFAKLSLELAKAHAVWVVVFNTSSPVSYPHGGQYLTLDVFPGKSLIDKLVAFLQRLWKLKAIKRSLLIDVSISFLEGADYINVLTKGKDKVIVSIRGSKLHDETMAGKFHWLRKKVLIPMLYKKADRLITVNKGIIQELVSDFKLPEHRVITIHNFYDGKAIRLQAAMPKDIAMDRFYCERVLVTSGRLAIEKGLPALLYIFNEVKKTNTRVKLIMIGNGSEYAKLLQICERCGLSASDNVSDFPDVLFLQNANNVYKFLNGAALYLMNSSSEGFPNGLAEALICGVPAVSSDCPYGPREIMLPNTTLNALEVTFTPCGVLLPRATDNNEHTRSLWAEAIGTLLNDEKLRTAMASAARQRMQDFEVENAIAKWQQIVME